MKTILAVIIAGLMASTVAMADDLAIGSVQTLEGTVRLTRSGVDEAVSAGQSLQQQDTLHTGPNGRVGIILRDDTILSLGPNSVLELKAYLFQPKEREFSLVVRMLKGTFVYLSGIMAKLAPDAIRLETPDSTIGIRGTRLLIQVEGA